MFLITTSSTITTTTTTTVPRQGPVTGCGADGNYYLSGRIHAYIPKSLLLEAGYKLIFNEKYAYNVPLVTLFSSNISLILI